jgi:hypothetical protein
MLREVTESGFIDRAAFAALAVVRYEANRGIWKSYYDFDLVNSVEARRNWVPPTLASLD